MLGQLGFFYKFAGSEIEDPRPRDRYINEAKRLLAVLEGAMAGQDWIAGDYSIADIALVPWLKALDFYGAKEVLGWDDHKNLVAWVDRFNARPAVERGSKIPATS
jgi:GST-like protein